MITNPQTSVFSKPGTTAPFQRTHRTKIQKKLFSLCGKIFPRPSHRSSSAYRPVRSGFTLVELLAVMGILALLAGIMVPAVVGIGKPREINAAAQTVSNLMTIARTEAITHRTVTRLAIVKNWAGSPDVNFRKLSIWRFDASSTTGWRQISKWEQLPASIAFEPSSPSYITDALPGNYILAGTQNSFTETIGGNLVELNFVEFLPTGAARMPQAAGPEFWITLVPGNVSNGAMVHLTQDGSGTPPNWAKISAHALTGRLKIRQP